RGGLREGGRARRRLPARDLLLGQPDLGPGRLRLHGLPLGRPLRRRLMLHARHRRAHGRGPRQPRPDDPPARLRRPAGAGARAAARHPDDPARHAARDDIAPAGVCSDPQRATPNAARRLADLGGLTHMTDATPIAWRAITYGTPVLASDSSKIGTVREALASAAAHI